MSPISPNPESACPEEESLWPLAMGEKTDKRLLDHVAQCEHCRENVARLQNEIAVMRGTADISGMTEEEQGPSRQPTRPARKQGLPDREATPAQGHSGDGDSHESNDGVSRYRPLRHHASGGLGRVWIAQDTQLHREVALKEIQEQHADNPENRSRFLLEAEITGSLEHPGIVPVYGLGSYGDGRPYYAMRFVRGETLRDAAERYHQSKADGSDPGGLALELRKLLGHFVDVCNAIEYAHSRGVLHRDLKPSNVMLGKYGETLVVDWGLAKSIGRDGQLKDQDEHKTLAEESTLLPASAHSSAPTVMGSALGTPAFMSPEQAAGRLDQLGPASDVYSLGATLYALLTNQAPFREASSLDEMLQMVERGEFPRPRQIDAKIPPPLESICLKAMALNPQDRYQSARALADEIEHWLADEPVTAHRESLLQRTRRWGRRHRGAVLATLTLGAIVVVGLVAGWFYWQRMPGSLTFKINQKDARIAIDGRRYSVENGSHQVDLPPGVYTFAVTAPDHEPQQHTIQVQRGKSESIEISLQHHQGTLEAECMPLGSEIEIDGVSFGSRIRNLPLDSGPHRLIAWQDNHFESRTELHIARGRTDRQRFFLDKGIVWRYAGADVQGVSYVVDDVNGDGKQDVMHVLLDHIALFSSTSGTVRNIRPSVQHTVQLHWLGPEIGQAVIMGHQGPRDADGNSPLTMTAFKLDDPGKDLWIWKGSTREAGPSAAYLHFGHLYDTDGRTVKQLYVPTIDGKVYLINAANGETEQTLSLNKKVATHFPEIKPYEQKNSRHLLVIHNVQKNKEDTGGNSATKQPGSQFMLRCVDKETSRQVWEKEIDRAIAVRNIDVDLDGKQELLVMTTDDWRILDGLSGKVRSQGAFDPDGTPGQSPYFLDCDGDGQVEMVTALTGKRRELIVMRLTDGKTLWRREITFQDHQVVQPESNHLTITEDGAMLIQAEDGLLAIDPQNGDTRWRLPGRPGGFLLADWDGDDRDEIVVGMAGRGIVCLNLKGKTLWTLRLATDVTPAGVLNDVDGDGLLEFIVTRHNALLAMIRGPRVIWRNQARAPLQATPLVLDVDGDRKAEVIQLGDWPGDQRIVCFAGEHGAKKWSVPFKMTPNRAPALVDFDGDGKKDVVCYGDWPDDPVSSLVMLRVDDGDAVRSVRLPDNSNAYATPGVGDINGDGVNDAALHRWFSHDVIAIDGRKLLASDPTQPKPILWKFETARPNIGEVAVADLDLDGKAEVIAPSLDGNLYAVRGSDGTELWKYRFGAPLRCGPTIADLDDNGELEVLLVTPSSTPTSEGQGGLFVLEGHSGKVLWNLPVPGTGGVIGKPVVSRVGSESWIVAPMGANGVAAFEFSSRRTVWLRRLTGPGANVHPVSAAPVVADLDKDGRQEVIVTTTTGFILVMDLKTGLPFWQLLHSPMTRRGDRTQGGIEAGPAVGDIDGDGILDIVIADSNYHITAISGQGVAAARRRLNRKQDQEIVRAKPRSNLAVEN